MKKLKLNLANMPNAQVLTREQLKKVTGGQRETGTCCWHSQSWDAFGCGISKETAIERANEYASETGRGFWCCDSCPEQPSPVE